MGQHDRINNPAILGRMFVLLIWRFELTHQSGPDSFFFCVFDLTYPIYLHLTCSGNSRV